MHNIVQIYCKMFYEIFLNEMACFHYCSDRIHKKQIHLYKVEYLKCYKLLSLKVCVKSKICLD